MDVMLPSARVWKRTSRMFFVSFLSVPSLVSSTQERQLSCLRVTMFKKRKRGGSKNARKRSGDAAVGEETVAPASSDGGVAAQPLPVENEGVKQRSAGKGSTALEGSRNVFTTSKGTKKRFKLSLDTDAKVFDDHNREQKRIDDAAEEAAATTRGLRRALERKRKDQKSKQGPVGAPANIRTTTVVDFQQAVCKDYKETGYCGFGDTCIYLHDRSQNLPTTIRSRAREWDVNKKKLSMGGLRRSATGANVAGRFLSSKTKDFTAEKVVLTGEEEADGKDGGTETSPSPVVVVATTKRYSSVLKSDGY